MMNNELLLTILQSQKIEYVLFDSAFLLVDLSPGVVKFLSPDRIISFGTYVTNIFVELLGYEQYLEDVRDAKAPPLQLDWINQEPLSISPTETTEQQPVTFFHLQVYPFNSGILVILRDVSEQSEIEQRVYRRHNELDMLSKKLIDDLKKANAELSQAYATTLEGWAKALEMRDGETKGHSERVIALTRTLCEVMGIPQEEITFYCYGALLHDIGKMGIPDHILLKPGRLIDTEWLIMKQHPILAENMLKSIKYLEKALSIPMYHHEKWNGEGYPYGLKGEEIPLPARIFSIVDVYDALRSDRPYRPAWTDQEDLRYIADRSGIDFDPEVVKKFLSLFPKFLTNFK